MTDNPLPRLISRALVAKSMGKSLRRFVDYTQADKTFPKPIRVGRYFMYLESDYLLWLKKKLKEREI